MSSLAAAQNAPTINPEDALAPIAVVEGAGVKVGEGTVLHPSIGMELGFVSNVFFEESNPVAAGLLRILGQIGTGSLSPQRLAPVEQAESTTPGPTNVGDFQYRADLRLQYDYYPSSNDAVSAQGGLGVGLLFRGIVNPQKPVQFAVVEDFQRLVRPTNFESSTTINRDINNLKLQLQWAPHGRNLSGVLHYTNTIDVFERETQQFANRFQNSLGLRFNWQWRPRTRIYTDVTQGVFTGLGSDSTKVTSYPLTAVAGINTLFTPSTTLSTRVGYTNGFYSTGPSFSAVVFGAQFGYRYSPLGRVSLNYNYLHNDSINANFYRDHAVNLTFQQALAPVLFVAQGGFAFRRYQGLIVTSGPMVRDDLVGSALAELRYNFRDWLATSINYQLTVVSTDYTYMTDGFLDDPSYTRHMVLAGVRAAY